MDYTPPPHTKVNEVVCWRVGNPTDQFDSSILERHGEIILTIHCEDGDFYLLIKKGAEMLNNRPPNPQSSIR